MNPSLHRRVTYDVVNLMDEHEVAARANAPIICCRNVFIYFSDQSIGRVLAIFERSMPDPAYLCIGASESLLRHATSFELKEIGGAFVCSRLVAVALDHLLEVAGDAITPHQILTEQIVVVVVGVFGTDVQQRRRHLFGG